MQVNYTISTDIKTKTCNFLLAISTSMDFDKLCFSLVTKQIYLKRMFQNCPWEITTIKEF